MRKIVHPRSLLKKTGFRFCYKAKVKNAIYFDFGMVGFSGSSSLFAFFGYDYVFHYWILPWVSPTGNLCMVASLIDLPIRSNDSYVEGLSDHVWLKPSPVLIFASLDEE